MKIRVDVGYGFGAVVLCLAVASPMIAANAAAQANHLGDPQLGRIYFEEKCVQCHGDDAFDEPAPKLDEIFGRTAGTRADFSFYSPAMKESAMVWNDANLDRFLAEPRAAIPGTLMNTRVEDTLDRSDVVAYLKTMKAEK